MNKIGEIQLNDQIKILDAFDFPEQFSKINISNIQKGHGLSLMKQMKMK